MRCLIIDDIDFNRDIARSALENLGFDVEEAGTFAEALKMLDKQSFELLLLDWIMPEAEGPEMLRRLHRYFRSKQKQPKILMHTVLDPQKHIEQAMESGADGFLQKPLTLPMLKSKLQEIGLAAA